MAAFASVSDLATYLQRDLSAADTATAELLLDLASGVIRSYTGQTISAASSTATIELTNGSDLLSLPQWPVTAVTSVTVAGTLYVLTTDYYVLLESGLIRFVNRRWSYPPEYAVVVYSHGHAVGSAGLALAQGVCLALASGAMQSAGGDIKSESIGNYEVTYDTLHTVLHSPESAGLRASLDSLRPIVFA